MSDVSDGDSPKLVHGNCPRCGLTTIRIVLEGNSHFNMIEGPNEWCSVLFGRCTGCRSCLEAHLDWNSQLDVHPLDWAEVDEGIVAFLLGDSPLA